MPAHVQYERLPSPEPGIALIHESLHFLIVSMLFQNHSAERVNAVLKGHACSLVCHAINANCPLSLSFSLSLMKKHSTEGSCSPTRCLHLQNCLVLPHWAHRGRETPGPSVPAARPGLCTPSCQSRGMRHFPVKLEKDCPPNTVG